MSMAFNVIYAVCSEKLPLNTVQCHKSSRAEVADSFIRSANAWTQRLSDSEMQCKLPETYSTVHHHSLD